MIPDDSPAVNDDWTETLAAFDDALAAGAAAELPPESASNLQPELKKTMAYARRVRQALAQLAKPAAAHTPSPQAFLSLGRFELLDVVGSGGFGTVYRARDRQLQRVVAIKIPRSERRLDAHDLDRFLRELRSVAQLRHPGIVPIHEVGQHEGMPYLVSDFVFGTTLAQLLATRRPPPQEAARMVAAVADALHYAHQQGVIHRDVKPSNILIDQTGVPHLMDFGLARREAVDVTMTQEGQLLGTPAYMSPEQARGQGHLVEGRADVYSLGVVLYQLLTGELPFRGNARALLNQVIYKEPRSLSSLNDQVPRDLETICLKAMAKEPERRYQTAVALADDLRSYLSGQAIAARPVSPLRQAWRWSQRNPTLAALLAMLAASLLVSTTISTALALRAVHSRERAEILADVAKSAEQSAAYQAREAEMARKQAEKDLRKAQRLLYTAQMTVIADAWERKDVATVLELLDTLVPPVGQEDLRGPDWHKIWKLTHGYRLSLGGPDAPCLSVRFLPDGKTLATTGKNHVQLWDLTTGKEKGPPLMVDALRTYQLCSQRDGSLLILGKNDTTQKVQVLRFKEGAISTLQEIEDCAGLMEASPDGTMLAGIVGTRVDVWDLGTRKKRMPTVELASFATQLVIAPDSKTLVVGTNAGHVKLIDLASGQEPKTLPGHTHAVTAAAYAGDGTLMATGSGDATVIVWDVATWRPFPIKVKAVAQAVQFSPDGALLAIGEQGVLKLYQVSSRTEMTTLYAHSARITSLQFSPDGKTIASASDDKTVKLWDLPMPATSSAEKSP